MTTTQGMIPFKDVDFAKFPWRIPTDRYTSQEVNDREREVVWMKIWQMH